MVSIEPPTPESPQRDDSQKHQQVIFAVLVLLVGGAVLLGVLLAGGNDSKEQTLPVSSQGPSPTPTVPPVDEESDAEPANTPTAPEQQTWYETGTVEIIGDALPADESVGHSAPAFKAQPNTSAEMVEIQPDDGTVRLIGFFAHWCPHCQREVPRVARWLNENDLPNGVEVVAISTSVREGTPNYPPSEWFEAENWPTQVLVDSPDKTLAAAFGLTGFPYWVLIDGEGTVIHRSSGELTEEQFSYLVYLAGTLAPQVA